MDDLDRELDHSSALRAGSEPVYALYLLVQAVLGVVLWVAIATSPTVRSWFELVPAVHDVTNGFFLADMGVVLASGLSAWAISARSPLALPMAAFTAGGVVYPTLYLVAFTSSTGIAVGALALMIAVSTVTCWITYQLYLSRR